MYEPIYTQYQYDVNANPLMVCSLCVFKKKPNEQYLNPDNRLTIVNGTMVCVDHLSMFSTPLVLRKWMNGSD